MTKVQRVFISRDLHPDSIFYQQLHSQGYEVIGESLIEFRAVPLSTVPDSDWIFFYSARAVSFLFEQFPPTTLKGQQYAAFGAGTAKALQKWGITPHFCGTGKGKSTAQAFRKVASGQRVLFPRAQHSQKTIQTLLQQEIQVIDWVVYDNHAKTPILIPPVDILVFTSPLNAQAYFQHYPLEAHQQVLAIGATTAKALQQLGIQQVGIAEQPSELALAQWIRSQQTSD